MHGWMIFIGRIAKSFLKIQIRSAESITGHSQFQKMEEISLKNTSFDRPLSPFCGWPEPILTDLVPVVPLNSTKR
jgi:hypothetical protein